MAVYTMLALDEMREALAPFELGQLIRADPVAAGIENTTYFATFEQSAGRTAEYVLTLGESIASADMEFVAGLTTLLHHHGLPVPAPVTTNAGTQVFYLAHKPALLIPKAAGEPPAAPSVQQCRALGNTLARLHRVLLCQPFDHTSHKSLDWVAATGGRLLPHLSGRPRDLLCSSLARLDAFVSAHEKLPRAVIHGDLFRDNTLFDGESVTAIIDFFSAGAGYLLFDVAVAANDWCAIDEDHFDPRKLEALLDGYCSIRPFTDEERGCWGEMLSIAALRFWVSRLADRIFPVPDRAPRDTKDPAPYQRLLIRHLQWPQSLNLGDK